MFCNPPGAGSQKRNTVGHSSANFAFGARPALFKSATRWSSLQAEQLAPTWRWGPLEWGNWAAWAKAARCTWLKACTRALSPMQMSSCSRRVALLAQNLLDIPGRLPVTASRPLTPPPSPEARGGPSLAGWRARRSRRGRRGCGTSTTCLSCRSK